VSRSVHQRGFGGALHRLPVGIVELDEGDSAEAVPYFAVA
jgi:hypothetical protein